MILDEHRRGGTSGRALFESFTIVGGGKQPSLLFSAWGLAGTSATACSFE